MNQAASAAQNHHNGPQPHSPAWHAQHPSAWQHTHPHADAVAVASTAAVTSWLAYGVHPATTTSSTTVVYGTPATADSAAPTADPDPAVAAGTGPEWLALGVYELSPSAAVASSQMVQLSISQSGVLRGVYFDHLTGTTQNLSGSVDTATQHVEWSLEGNPSARFATTLTDLTQPRGAVTVTLPNGEQTWAISRAGGV